MYGVAPVSRANAATRSTTSADNRVVARCARQVLGTTEPLGPGSSSGSGRFVISGRQ